MGVTYLLLLSTLGLAIHTQAQDCPTPIAGDNMTLKGGTSQTFQDGTTVSFACDIGFSSVGGSSSITCTSGTWSPVKLRCERRNCGSAGEVPNGNVDYPEGTEFGHQLIVTCKLGYSLVGKSKIICGVQGWEERLPHCEVVTCFLPNSNVSVSPIKESYGYLEVIQYTCPQDSTLSGSKSSSCSEDGQFNPVPPTCVMVACKEPVIAHATWLRGSRPPYKYLSTVTFKCITGYTMNGADTLTCNINSQWSPALPTCQPVQCEVPKVLNADLVDGPQPTYKYLSTVTFKCISGYTMTGEQTQTCEKDGSWLPGLPECQPVPTTKRPSTTKKTAVGPGPTDPPGNNGNGKAIGLGIGLAAGIVFTIIGCYCWGVPAIKRRWRKDSPDNVVPKEEEVALS